MSVKPEKVLPANYGSVAHLPGSCITHGDHQCNPGHARIATAKSRKGDVVYVEEKLDGTNVGVLRAGSELIAIQRSGYRCDSSPYEMHHRFAKFVERSRDQFLWLLRDGERVCGEWLDTAHGTRYDLSGFESPFFAFDIKVGAQHVSREESRFRIDRAFLQQPCLIHAGSAIKVEDALGKGRLVPTIDDGPEGLVYRVERLGYIFDFMVKWVAPNHDGGKYLPGVGAPAEAMPVLNWLEAEE